MTPLPPDYYGYLDGDALPRTLIVVDTEKVATELRARLRHMPNFTVTSIRAVAQGRRYDMLIFALANKVHLRIMEPWHNCIRPGGLIVGSPYYTLPNNTSNQGDK